MRKKIVLYNTTIDALLKYDEKAIRKMEYVFHFFERKDDLALIWRPHPLLEATVRSMRPNLLEKYLKLVDDYKNREIGILDESSDLHRAIALSDVYYGDWSSVVDLYRVTGKPVLIQDMSVLEPERLTFKWAVHGYTVHIYQDRIYTALAKGDALLWKEKGGKLSVIKHLKGGSSKKLLYSMSIICEGKIFFAPWNAASFSCYDIASSETREIPMDEPSGNEVLYLVQCGGEIRAVGMNSRKVYRYDEAADLFRCILPGREKRDLYALKRIRTYDYIPFADRNTNELCVYHVSQNEWRDYPFQKGCIRDLMYDGEWCWIITETGSMVKWDISAGLCLEEKRVSADLETVFLFDCGEKLLLLQGKGAGSIRIEKGTLQAEEEILSVLEDGLQHYFSEVTDTQILVESYKKDRCWYTSADEGFQIYDYMEKKVTWKDLNDADENCQAELERLYEEEGLAMAEKRGKILIEKPNRSLDFLCSLLSTETEGRSADVPLCGGRIHMAMMEDI